jgi:glutathione S-transferase
MAPLPLAPRAEVASWPLAGADPPGVPVRFLEAVMDIILYYAPNACSLVPYVTLTEANAAFEVRPLNFRKGQQMSADYLKLNPKHKVPLLIVDGKPLTENVAIQTFIARSFPRAKLLPSDPWQELQAISILAWCAAGIHPFLSRLNSPPRVCDVAGADESVRRLAKEFLFEGYKIADDMLKGREYFFDHFTAADAHFFWCLRRGVQLDVDPAGFAHCAAHFERMQRRPSVQKALAYEKSVLEEFAKVA